MGVVKKRKSKPKQENIVKLNKFIKEIEKQKK
jgi:hypothetical protein